jgi:hypothetical protein
MSKGGISMITVFDVATEEELKEMFSFDGEEYDKEKLLEAMKRSPDYNNAELALLYSDRGDVKKSETYLALIKDSEYRQDVIHLIYELIV